MINETVIPMSFTFYQINTIILFATDVPNACQRLGNSSNKLFYKKMTSIPKPEARRSTLPK